MKRLFFMILSLVVIGILTGGSTNESVDVTAEKISQYGGVTENTSMRNASGVAAEENNDISWQKEDSWPSSEKNAEPEVKRYKQKITNNEPLILEGDVVFVINNTHYIQRNDIVVRDNATLLITNSLFEHRNAPGRWSSLEAFNTSRVSIQDSEIRSSNEIDWNFRSNSFYILKDVEEELSFIRVHFVLTPPKVVEK